MRIKNGRRIHVTAPYGRMVHEVRLQCVEEKWQARVITLPNQIWVEPGAKRALVFEAASEAEAEEMAIDFIQKDVIARGHRLENPTATNRRSTATLPARRVIASFPLRFIAQGGPLDELGRRSCAGRTANLSETGLFIVTGGIVPPKSQIAIELRMPGLPARLEGVVVWGRRDFKDGMHVGMGVHLLEPSLSYRARVQSLA